jgi:hypothetical protein
VSDTGRLAFAIGDRGDDEVAIEVRNARLVLIGRYPSSRTVDVPAGKYYVAARLPDGTEATDWVEVLAGKDAIATLVIDPESLPEQEPPSLDVDGGLAFDSFDNVKSVPTEPAFTARVWRGIAGAFERGDELEVERTEPARWRVHIPGSVAAGTLLVEVGSRAPQPTWVVVPHEPGDTSFVELTVQDHEVRARPWLRNTRAASLLRYVARRDLRSARIVADASHAEQLLYEKRADALGAAIGAYALLAMRDLERMHDWSERLCYGFDWLADGAVIRGEHLARLGRADESLACFLLLEKRGLPAISDGLDYAVDRLASAKDERAVKLLARLRPYARHADARRAFVTFAADDPNELDGVRASNPFEGRASSTFAIGSVVLPASSVSGPREARGPKKRPRSLRAARAHAEELAAQAHWDQAAELLREVARDTRDAEEQMRLYLEVAEMMLAQLDDRDGALDVIREALQRSAPPVVAELADVDEPEIP